jgi:hypothetical protein
VEVESSKELFEDFSKDVVGDDTFVHFLLAITNETIN